MRTPDDETSMTTSRRAVAPAGLGVAALVLVGCADDEASEPTDAATEQVDPQLDSDQDSEEDPEQSDEDDEGGENEDESDDESSDVPEGASDPEAVPWQPTEQPPDPDELGRPSTEEVEDTSDLSREGLSEEELVVTAAETMVTWDSTVDASVTDARIRALDLFVDEFDEIFVAPANPIFPDDWWEAAEHDAATVPHVEITETFDDEVSRTYQVVAHWTWVGERDEWSLRAGPQEMTFIVEEHDDGDPIIQNWTEGGFQ